MYEFGEKHPIGFEIILIIVSFLAAGVIVMACSIVNMHADLSSSIARIFVALVLLVIYRRAFTGQNPLYGTFSTTSVRGWSSEEACSSLRPRSRQSLLRSLRK